MIALEPEAASLYCMYQPIKEDSNNCNFRAFKAGEKYMVVDAGGTSPFINIKTFLKFPLKHFSMLLSINIYMIILFQEE